MGNILHPSVRWNNMQNSSHTNIRASKSSTSLFYKSLFSGCPFCKTNPVNVFWPRFVVFLLSSNSLSQIKERGGGAGGGVNVWKFERPTFPKSFTTHDFGHVYLQCRSNFWKANLSKQVSIFMRLVLSSWIIFRTEIQVTWVSSYTLKSGSSALIGSTGPHLYYIANPIQFLEMYCCWIVHNVNWTI